MITYNKFRGRAFILNFKYPIYDEDEIIGYSSKNDVAVASNDCFDGDIEFTIATGKYAGYDALCLSISDIHKAIYLGDKDENCVFVNDIKIR